MFLIYSFLSLENLRHLLHNSEGLINVFTLNALRNLETLKRVRAKSLIRDNAVQLTNLRNVAVKFERGDEVEVVLKSPCVASGLVRSLKMEMSLGTSFPNLERLSACEDLTKVVLKGKISEDSLEFLPSSITKLILCRSELNHDPMVILEKLRNLRYLCLEEDAYSGSKMVCSANGFRKLEIMELRLLRQLKEWRIEKGSMPCLKTLSLRSLKRLRRVPEGLKSVTTLEEFLVSYMTYEFYKDITGINGVMVRRL